MPSTLEEKSQQRIAKAVKDQPQRSDGWTSSLRAPNSISSMAKNRYGKPPDVEPVKKTLEDLKQGIISPFVRESFKLIDQDHPASQHANKLCLKILKRIYPSHDFDKEPVRFLLMDMPDVNACYFKGSEPITICISKNILERLYSDDPKKRMAVDDLAYILGHEYTHFKTFKEFGYTDSCKLQECNCDLDPIEDIVKAGFNRNAGMRVQKLFGESNKRMSALERAFKALVDPHPDPAHRKKMVGGKLAQLRFEKGVFKTNEVSYLKTNPDIQSLISSATYKDWLTEFFEEASYTELGHLAKASVVTEAASIITSSPLCSVYATQLLDTLDEFSKSGTKKSKEVLNLIAEYAIETICTGLKQLDGEDKEQYSSRAEASIDLLGSLYKKCVQGIRFDPNLSRLERAGRFKFGGPLDPIGSLLVLENIIVDLTLADDRDSIRAFAREINLFSWPSLEQRSFEPKLNAARRGFFRSIEMTNFHKPGKDESVSWNAHVIAAIEDIEQQDFTIAKALLKLGVFDQRLVLALPKDMRDKLLNPVEQDRPVSFSSHEDRVDFPDHSEASSQTRSLSPLRRSSEVSSLVVDEVGKVLRREAIRLEESNLPELVDQWIEAMQSKDLSKAPFLDVVRRELSNSWHGTRQEVDCLRKLFREIEKQIYQLNQNIDAERRIFQDLIDFSKFARNHVCIKLMTDVPNFYGHNVYQFGAYLEVTCTRHTHQSLAKELAALESRDPELYFDCINGLFTGEPAIFFDKVHVLKSLMPDPKVERAEGGEEKENPINDPLVKLLLNSKISLENKTEALSGVYIGGSLEEIKKLHQDSKEKIDQTPLLSFAASNYSKKENLWSQLSSDADSLSSSETLLALRELFKDSYKQSPPKNWRELAEFAKNAYEEFKDYKSKKHVDCLIMAEAFNLLKTQKPTFSDIEIFLKHLPDESLPRFSDASFRLKADIREALSKQNYTIASGKTAKESLEEFIFLHDAEIARPTQLNAFANYTLDQIEKLGSAETRIELIQELFTEYFFSSKNRLTHPVTRRRAFNIFCTALVEVYGIDQETDEVKKEEYKDKILKESEKIRDSLMRSNLQEFNSILAETIQSQEDLAFNLRDQVSKLTINDLDRSNNHGGSIESTILLLKSKRELNEDIFNFLVEPMTERSCDCIAEKLRNANLWDHQVGFKLPKFTNEEAEKDFYRDFAALIYENFWEASMPLRIAVVSQIVNPESDKEFTEDDLLFHDLLYRLFEDQSGEEAEFAKRHITSFVQAYEESYEREALMLGMMVAVKTNSEEELRVGQRLAILLESLGPLPIKAGQKGSSDPRVRQDIAEDLERLENAANPIEYWQVHSLIAREPELKEEIKRTGKILGSGSLFVVVEVELHSGETEVVALLRDNIRELIAADLYTFQRYLKNLGDDPDAVLFGQIVEKGKEAALNEANISLALRQHQTAGENYDGEIVRVVDTDFELAACKLTASGKTYKRMEKAPGVHFSDLPTETKQQKRFKKKVAAAVVAKELQLRLQGKPTDFDRHGSNILIDGNLITHIDLGAQEISDPSKKDLQTLGEIIGHCLVAVKNGKPMIDAMTDEMNDRIESFTPYLSNLNNSLLALRKYMNELDEKTILQILGSIATQGFHPQIEAGIEKGIKKKLGGFFSLKLLGYNFIKLFKRNKNPSQLMTQFDSGLISFSSI